MQEALNWSAYCSKHLENVSQERLINSNSRIVFRNGFRRRSFNTLGLNALFIHINAIFLYVVRSQICTATVANIQISELDVVVEYRYNFLITKYCSSGVRMEYCIILIF